MAKVVFGDVFGCPRGNGDYLMHQCNCVSAKAAHLSADVFRRYPEADIYTPRAAKRMRGVPGTVQISGSVINLLGQYYPGKSRFTNDTYFDRIRWFEQALNKLDKEVPDLQTLSVPYGMGCGAAGGNWAEYREVLDRWARSHPAVDVHIYKRVNDPWLDENH